jgi:hypothetical protein
VGNLKNRRGEEPSRILPIAAELELFCSPVTRGLRHVWEKCFCFLQLEKYENAGSAAQQAALQLPVTVLLFASQTAKTEVRL